VKVLSNLPVKRTSKNGRNVASSVVSGLNIAELLSSYDRCTLTGRLIYFIFSWKYKKLDLEVGTVYSSHPTVMNNVMNCHEYSYCRFRNRKKQKLTTDFTVWKTTKKQKLMNWSSSSMSETVQRHPESHSTC